MENNNQSRSAILPRLISECKDLLVAQKEQRNLFIIARDTVGNEDYSNTLIAIAQLENDISNYESESRTLGCHNEEEPKISYDSQTVISNSSVQRKDSAALKKIEYQCSIDK